MVYSAEQLKAIASRVRQDIDNYCLEKFKQDRRTHLGASEVGEECSRRLWYQWRWIKRKQFNARMLRLFDRGHKEEGRFIDWLRGAGFTVYDINPATGEQFTFAEWGDHYGGGTDALIAHPVHFPNEGLVGEFKTHNDKYFQQLLKSGMKVAQPKHWAQMCNYGFKFGCRLGIYCAANKDDDELHIEIHELDWSLASAMSETARVIIGALVPPQRMHNASPSFYKCKLCESIGVCFYNDMPDKNCRSCQFARPIDSGEWHCLRWNSPIPKETIPIGCGDYKAIV